mmetsp:Transcript_10336/g.15580  ORF Transcript_10336/g.15580 Transcript_10336/m.15580 type:complete len:286 (+) Transcript_10336:713-1570(+)
MVFKKPSVKEMLDHLICEHYSKLTNDKNLNNCLNIIFEANLKDLNNSMYEEFLNKINVLLNKNEYKLDNDNDKDKFDHKIDDDNDKDEFDHKLDNDNNKDDKDEFDHKIDNYNDTDKNLDDDDIKLDNDSIFDNNNTFADDTNFDKDDKKFNDDNNNVKFADNGKNKFDNNCHDKFNEISNHKDDATCLHPTNQNESPTMKSDQKVLDKSRSRRRHSRHILTKKTETRCCNSVKNTEHKHRKGSVLDKHHRHCSGHQHHRSYSPKSSSRSSSQLMHGRRHYSDSP